MTTPTVPMQGLAEWLLELAVGRYQFLPSTTLEGWASDVKAAARPHAAPGEWSKEIERLAHEMQHRYHNAMIWSAQQSDSGESVVSKAAWHDYHVARNALLAQIHNPAAPQPAGAAGGALTDAQIDRVLGEAYTKLVKDTGYNGGMGGETWDRAAARAIEAELRGTATTSEPATPVQSDAVEVLRERKAILDMLDEYIPENGVAWDAVNEIRALIAKRGEA